MRITSAAQASARIKPWSAGRIPAGKAASTAQKNLSPQSRCPPIFGHPESLRGCFCIQSPRFHLWARLRSHRPATLHGARIPSVAHGPWMPATATRRAPAAFRAAPAEFLVPHILSPYYEPPYYEQSINMTQGQRKPTGSCMRGQKNLSGSVAGFCSSRAWPLFPLAYKFTEGAGSDGALASLPGAHLDIQAFGETCAATVAAVPATPPPLDPHGKGDGFLKGLIPSRAGFLLYWGYDWGYVCQAL